MDFKEDMNKSAKPYFPAFLSLHGKDCLVIGGGTIAYGKAKALVACGAKVMVVSPVVSLGLRKLRAVSIKKRKFRRQDLGGKGYRPWLVVAATDDAKVNQEIFQLCQERGLWVNTVDQPEICNFIYPAVVRRGNLTFAISTGGASPALAKHVRSKLQKTFGPGYAALLGALRRSRPLLMKMPLPQRRRFISRLLNPAISQDFNQQRLKLWERDLKRMVGK